MGKEQSGPCVRGLCLFDLRSCWLWGWLKFPGSGQIKKKNPRPSLFHSYCLTDLLDVRQWMLFFLFFLLTDMADRGVNS